MRRGKLVGVLILGAAMLGSAPLVGGLFRMPAPSGRFAVGTAEITVPADGASAALPASLWYPEAARGPLPLIVYLPGWDGSRTDNAVLAADLASQGFAVAAVDDTLRNGAMDFSSDAARAATLAHIDARLEAGTRAASRLLDALGTQRAGWLNVARAGILGFSFGGATAAEASLRDRRFVAVVNMDGWVFGRASREGVRRPYLLMSDGTPGPTAAQLASPDPAIRVPAEVDDHDLRQQAALMAVHGGFKVTLLGATHVTFTDALLRSPLRRLRALRGLDPVTAQAAMAAYSATFFRYVLLQEGDALPDPSVYPKIRTDLAVPCRDGDWTNAGKPGQTDRVFRASSGVASPIFD